MGAGSLTKATESVAQRPCKKLQGGHYRLGVASSANDAGIQLIACESSTC